jgi:hypothetical protein
VVSLSSLADGLYVQIGVGGPDSESLETTIEFDYWKFDLTSARAKIVFASPQTWQVAISKGLRFEFSIPACRNWVSLNIRIDQDVVSTFNPKKATLKLPKLVSSL